MDASTYERCTQRGCIRFGLWHTARDTGHRFRTVRTALAAVSIEKRDEDGPWTVWLARGDAAPVQVNAPPDPTTDVAHEDHMELRAAVLYALRSAEKFNT
ncbi:hypothetical protein ACNUCX_16135 [Curtobacterium flaccumfaciens pv. flaccumfaciens]|uniref:hypothetical protein n=1 Tax=Curtobacterium flaccumfaciens TaxID=2035 RepID=UPI003AB60B01